MNNLDDIYNFREFQSVFFRFQIEEMIEKVSYPDYILDTKFVDDYYKQVFTHL